MIQISKSFALHPLNPTRLFLLKANIIVKLSSISLDHPVPIIKEYIISILILGIIDDEE